MGIINSTFARIAGKKPGRLQKEWVFEVRRGMSCSVAADVDESGKTVIYFGTRQGEFYCVYENQVVKWLFRIDEPKTEIEKIFLEEESITSINSTPVIIDINRDGKKEILFGAETKKVYALSNEGKLIWDFGCRDAVRGGICVEDVNSDFKYEIIFGSNDGFLYCLDPKGRLVWKFKADSGIESTPAIMRKGKQTTIIFGTNSGMVYAVDGNGGLLWSQKTGGKVTSPAAFGNIYGDEHMFIVLGSQDGNLYVFDERGQLEWKYSTEGKISSSVIIADINRDGQKEIIVAGCDDRVTVLSCKGSRLWGFEADFWFKAEPILMDIDGDGKLEIVVGSYDHKLYVLDSEPSLVMNYIPGVSGVMYQTGSYSTVLTSNASQYDGNLLWQFDVGGMIEGLAVLSNGIIIASVREGKLVALSFKNENG
jgi:outer membrane protein assembly factor BamB